MPWLLCLLILLIPIPGAAQTDDALTPEKPIAAAKMAPEVSFHGAQTFTLDNGLQVVVIPNHRAPVATYMLWYKVGAADEKPGLSGMAHYFEHLMFKGTKTLEPGEYSRRVRLLGGNDNAFTSQDYTAYFASVPVGNLPDILRMEADRMQNLSPPPDHFASEKAVVIEERRQRTDTDPRARFTEQLQTALFTNHPYANPVIGWMEEIERYEWADVKGFYDTWYAPNNTILIISGDVTEKSVQDMAQDIFGTIARKNIPSRPRPRIPPAEAHTQIALSHVLIQQPIWQYLTLAPAAATNKKDWLALQVLEEVLSGGPTTRLYDSLVVKQKKAVNAGLSYNGAALDYGTITLFATPAPGVALEELEAVMFAELNKIIKEGVSADEVYEATQRLSAEAIYAHDSLSSPAMMMGSALATGLSFEDIQSWPADILTITPADVQRVAAAYLDRAKPWIRAGVSGYLTPEAEGDTE